MTMDKVVARASFDYGVDPESELHAHDIFAGKRDWETLAPMTRARIGIYDEALQAIADHDVTVIIRSVNITGLDRRYPGGHDHPHSIVLTHLIERVDEYVAARGERTILIADEVDAQDSYRRDLWRYQRSATWGIQGTQDRVRTRHDPLRSKLVEQTGTGRRPHRLPGPPDRNPRRDRRAGKKSQRCPVGPHPAQDLPQLVLAPVTARSTKARRPGGPKADRSCLLKSTLDYELHKRQLIPRTWSTR